MTILYWVSVFVFGAIFGSFFYTTALRYENGLFEKSLLQALTSSSRCPECDNKIPPLYLIPVAGYFLSAGKCKKCSSRISPAYPVSEILYGLIAVSAAAKFGVTAYSVVIFFIFSLAVTISVIDAKTMIVPTALVIILLIFTIYPIILHGSIKDNLYGMAAATLFFFVIMMLFPGSFGGGDLKLASVIGLFLGVELSIVFIETALVTGAVSGIIYALKTKKGFRTRMPFAPFLTAGMITAVYYGRDIILVYYNMMKI